MTLMDWATHVLQWQLQNDMNTQVFIKHKRCRCSDSSLKFEDLKPESLVIVDQYAT